VCPFDGWRAEGFRKAVLAAVTLADGGGTLSVEALRHRKVPEEVLTRAIMIEPSDEPGFEALDPAGYLIEGKWTAVNRAGLKFK
jgi:hypothetical protein